MPKYDAFGREIGEDTLAGLGGESSSEPTANPVPADGWAETAATEVPIAPPAETGPPTFTIPDSPPIAPVRMRRRRGYGGLGCLFSLLILGVVVAGPIIAIVSFVDDADEALTDVQEQIDDAVPDIPGVPDPDAPGQPDEPGPPPKGIAGRSMIAPDNVRKAVRVLRGTGQGDLGGMTVRPDFVMGSLITRRDNRRFIYLTYDGTLRRDDRHDIGIPQKTVPWSAVDPQAPARLVRGSARQFRVKPNGINYLIFQINPIDGRHYWIAYFKNGIYVEGDADGDVVRRIA